MLPFSNTDCSRIERKVTPALDFARLSGIRGETRWYTVADGHRGAAPTRLLVQGAHGRAPPGNSIASPFNSGLIAPFPLPGVHTRPSSRVGCVYTRANRRANRRLNVSRSWRASFRADPRSLRDVQRRAAGSPRRARKRFERRVLSPPHELWRWRAGSLEHRLVWSRRVLSHGVEPSLAGRGGGGSAQH